MFYHVLVEPCGKVGGNAENKQYFEFDKTDKDELISDILIPYLNDEEFQVDGHLLKKSSIDRFKVLTTKKSAAALADEEDARTQANNRNSNGLVVWSFKKKDMINDDSLTTDITKSILNEARALVKGNSSGETPPVKKDRTSVFIVHGHDNEAKLEVARLIEKLGIIPIILHEQPNQGQTIIEKIESHSDVGFAVILYTPCDFGKAANESEHKPRARQNVVFEHGYFVAKIGRKNVCALLKGDIETPSDNQGILYIKLDSAGAWRGSLAKELKNSGYEIDMNRAI